MRYQFSPTAPFVIVLNDDGSSLTFDATGTSWLAQAYRDSGIVADPAPAPPIEQVRAALLLRIDADVDATIDMAIGSRGDEYHKAADDATAFKAAGYAGTVPAYIADYASIKGWTAQHACDDILVTATAWVWARDAMRSKRLTSKEATRTAATLAALATAEAAWKTSINTIRTTIGLPAIA